MNSMDFTLAFLIVLWLGLRAVRLFAALMLIRLLFVKLRVPKRFVMALWIVYFAALSVPFRIPVATYLFGETWLEIRLEEAVRARTDDVRGQDAVTISAAGEDGPTSVFVTGELWEKGGFDGEPDDKDDAGGASRAAGAPVSPLTGEDVFFDNASGIDILQALTLTDPRAASLVRRAGRTAVLFWLWPAGAVFFLTFALARGLRLKKRLAESVPAEAAVPAEGAEGEGRNERRRFFRTETAIRISDQIHTPLVFGYFPPRIYLPTGLAENVRPYAVAHERTHIRRRHPWGKLAAYFVVCIHWFNPFVWIAFHLMSVDMEMVCDEETVRRLGEDERKHYAEALLTMSLGEGVRRHVFAMSPLTFEEGDAKKRLQNLADWKKAAPFVLVLAGVAIAGLALAAFIQRKPVNTLLLKNPGESPDDLPAEAIIAEAVDAEAISAEAVDAEAVDAEAIDAEAITAEVVDAEAARYQYVLDAYPGSWYAFAAIPRSAATYLSAAEVTKAVAADAADTVLLRAENVYEDHGERHAALCEVYRRIGNTYVRAGEIRTDGTAYPICADAGGIYVMGPHFAAHYTLSETVIDTSEDVTETFDPSGAPVYTLYYRQRTGNGNDADWTEEEITETEYNDIVSAWGDVPAVDFSPVPQTTSHNFAAWSEEIGAEAADPAASGESFRSTADVLAAYEDRTLETRDYRAMEGANVERIIPGGTRNYYAEIPLMAKDGVRYELRASYGIFDDALENLYLWRPSDGDNLWLWHSPDAEWRISVENQDADGYISRKALDAFLARASFDIGEHVKLDLPTGYEIGAYRADLGWSGGALILPQTYFPSEESHAPEEWQYAGFAGQMRADFVQAQGQETEGAFSFTGGLPSTTGLPMNNHTERSEVERVFRAGGLSSAAPYLYYTEKRDLYTAAGAFSYEERTGKTLAEEEMTSDYHVFVFPVEGAENWFYLELDARTFTEATAKAIAESAVYTPW